MVFDLKWDLEKNAADREAEGGSWAQGPELLLPEWSQRDIWRIPTN